MIKVTTTSTVVFLPEALLVDDRRVASSSSLSFFLLFPFLSSLLISYLRRAAAAAAAPPRRDRTTNNRATRTPKHTHTHSLPKHALKIEGKRETIAERRHTIIRMRKCSTFSSSSSSSSFQKDQSLVVGTVPGRGRGRRSQHHVVSSRSKTTVLVTMIMTLLLLLSSFVVERVTAQIACTTTEDCQRTLSGGNAVIGVSECLNGSCTNPYAQGCLRAMEQAKQGEDSSSSSSSSTTTSTSTSFLLSRKRICNSDDVAMNDYSNCDRSEISTTEFYKEVRILAGDWESSIFLSWAMQIFLSEYLDVPVTIETAASRNEYGSLSFYDIESYMAYPLIPYNYDALQRSLELNGDCTQADLSSGTDSCGHIMPEVWSGQINAWEIALTDEYIEPPEGNGMVGEFSFMIPSQLAQDDPSLISWYGYQDRTKLASTFLRPTTWYEYCMEVSINNCNMDNENDENENENNDTMIIAKRFPNDESEQNVYFMEGLYTGYFRATDKNNCTKYPTSCTGHVVDAPCDWDTITESQMYWNNIALSSDGPLQPNGGYSYFQMIEIWNAANATQSPVFLWWWKPDGLDQLYANTNYALQPVILPPPTEECEENRVNNVQRCSDNELDRLGSVIGSCAAPAHSLQKILSTSLFNLAYSESEALRSPSYEFLKRFRISDLSVTIILQQWLTNGIGDPYGIDPRTAVCGWVYEHFDELKEKFVPPGYPRVFAEDFSNALYIVTVTIGSVTLVLVLLSTIMVIKYRETKVFRYAHVPFVKYILFGLFLVCTGSITSAFRPTDALCLSYPILTVLGYTVELMPLVVKVSAVNRLIERSKRMRKVVINTKLLHFQVLSVVSIVLIYVIVWSVVDPQKLVENYYLVEQGENLVNVSATCASESSVWMYATFIWTGFLLLSALVLAVQSRNVKQEFNESQSLAFVVYSHTLFLVVRALIYSLPPENFTKSNVQNDCISLCLSLDSLNTLIVYFFPKFYVIWKGIGEDGETSRGNGATTARSSVIGVHSRSRSDGQHNGTLFDEPSRVIDEPPPMEEEMKELMSKACQLLVQAALIEDEQKEKLLKAEQKENLIKAEQPSSISNKITESPDDDEWNSRIKENHFLTKEELLSLRDISRRIGRARFDWEGPAHYSEVRRRSTQISNSQVSASIDKIHSEMPAVSENNNNSLGDDEEGGNPKLIQEQSLHQGTDLSLAQQQRPMKEEVGALSVSAPVLDCNNPPIDLEGQTKVEGGGGGTTLGAPQEQQNVALSTLSQVSVDSSMLSVHDEDFDENDPNAVAKAKVAKVRAMRKEKAAKARAEVIARASQGPINSEVE